MATTKRIGRRTPDPSAKPDRAVSCRHCPLRTLPVFRPFEADELKFVEWFKAGERRADAGETILHEGESSPHLYTILEGSAFRYKMLPDGRRQILSFALPGDMIGMQAQVLKEMQHSVEAMTRVRLCVLPRGRLWKLYASHPELAHDLVWLATRGERLADEHLLSIGRRSAVERIAYLLLHLYNRCRALQLTDGRAFEFPIRQRHIADALGLSLVHTNKTLRRLQGAGLIHWSADRIEVRNEKDLRRLAQYDESDAERRPII